MHFLRQNPFWYLMCGALSHSLIETLIWTAGFPLPTCVADMSCAGAQGFAVHSVKNPSCSLCHISVAQLLKDNAGTSTRKAERNKKWNIFLKKQRAWWGGAVFLAGDAVLQANTAMSRMIHAFVSFHSFTGGRRIIMTWGQTDSVAQKCL